MVWNPRYTAQSEAAVAIIGDMFSSSLFPFRVSLIVERVTAFLPVGENCVLIFLDDDDDDDGQLLKLRHKG